MGLLARHCRRIQKVPVEDQPLQGRCQPDLHLSGELHRPVRGGGLRKRRRLHRPRRRRQTVVGQSQREHPPSDRDRLRLASQSG